MNGRIYDPLLGMFISCDNFVQNPTASQNFNRYTYCMGNPFKYTDPKGQFWHIVIGAAIGGIINCATTWNSADGFLEHIAAFAVGAGAGAATAATGGCGFWAVAGVSAVGGASTMATNSVIAQTGKNFSGMNGVNWGQVAEGAAVGSISGFASGGAGYWAANSSWLVNGYSSPVLRSVIVSPLAAGAGHIAGGTAGGMFHGQSFDEAFQGSFNGIGQSMAFGAAMGVASTVGTSFANGINPLTGEFLMPRTSTVQYNLHPDELGDNVKLYRGTTGSEGKGALFMTTDPDYAATYVQNGGHVIEIVISRSTFQQMGWDGVINPLNGVNSSGGSKGAVFRIDRSNSNIINKLLQNSKKY